METTNCYTCYLLDLTECLDIKNCEKMEMSDVKYYERREQHNERRIKALSKAQHRGNVSVEWHKTNKLTTQTLPEFKKVMKQADKEWELQNKKQ